MQSVLLLISIVTGVLGHTDVPSFDPTSGAAILCVYKDKDYEKDEVCYTDWGYHKAPYNDRISSFKVAEGCRVEMTDDLYLQGPTEFFEDNVKNLKETMKDRNSEREETIRLNDRISSFEINCYVGEGEDRVRYGMKDLRNPKPSLPGFNKGGNLLCVYKDPGFKKEEKCYDKTGTYDAPYNDDISSFKLAKGCSVKMGRHKNFSGNWKETISKTYDGDVQDLELDDVNSNRQGSRYRGNLFNNEISALEIFCTSEKLTKDVNAVDV